MRISEKGMAILREFEQGPKGGFASVPYRDWAGHQTIGWGHRILNSERFDIPITALQADELLRADLDRFERAVSKCVRVPITQAMFDALVCFAFNVGSWNFHESTLLRLLNAGKYEGAAAQFERWDKATNPRTGEKEPLRGLTRRRLAERALFESGGILPT